MNKLFYRLCLLLSFAVGLLMFSAAANAQNPEIIAEGTYNMGDSETPSVAEEQALLAAKRIALEQAGTYVESYSRTQNYQLTHDEVQVLSAGIMEVKILDKKRSVADTGGICFWVKISASVTVEKIETMAARVKDKGIVEDYKQLQANLQESQQTIATLKKELQDAKDNQSKENLKAQINKNEQVFQANLYLGRAQQLAISKAYYDAIDAYSQALRFQPNLVQAYSGRGRAYSATGNLEKALSDFNRAIALNPSSPAPYLAKAATLEKLHYYNEALASYQKFLMYVPSHHTDLITKVERRIRQLENRR